MNDKLLRFRDLQTRNIVKNWVTLQRWIEREGFPAGLLLGPNTRPGVKPKSTLGLPPASSGNPAVQPARRLKMEERFLEISPLKSDDGELIGKHPADVPSPILAQKFRAQNPLKAIREKCLDCCCGNASEVRKCVAVDCPLWPFRMSTNPFRKKPELSSAQKRARLERLSKPSCAS